MHVSFSISQCVWHAVYVYSMFNTHISFNSIIYFIYQIKGMHPYKKSKDNQCALWMLIIAKILVNTRTSNYCLSVEMGN